MIFELYTGYPPSVNNYYTQTQRGRFISARGRAFRERVAEDVSQQLGGMDTVRTKVRVDIVAWAPDRRRRDLDNILKPLFDALTHAGVWGDDVQVDQLCEYRGTVVKEGCLYIKVTEAAPCIPIGMQHLIDNGD